MPAYFETGFVVGEQAWHGLATVRATPPATAEEAQHEAGLVWDVRLQRVFLNDDGYVGVQAPSHYAVVRERQLGSPEILGVVGRQYRPIQNIELFRMLEPFVKAGLMTFDTAGSLREGRRVWAQGLVKGVEGEVVPGDTVSSRLLVVNTHDGTARFTVKWTGVRAVCDNTVSAALVGGGLAMTLRHTSGAKSGLEAIRNALNVYEKNFDGQLKTFRTMAKIPVDAAGLDTFLRGVWELGPTDDEPGAFHQIRRLYENGRGTDLPGVRGTLWGAFNAVTEYVRHVRGTSAAARFDSQLFGRGGELLSRAGRIAAAMTK